jgi:hypothetical protein
VVPKESLPRKAVAAKAVRQAATMASPVASVSSSGRRQSLRSSRPDPEEVQAEEETQGAVGPRAVSMAEPAVALETWLAAAPVPKASSSSSTNPRED